MSCVQCTVYISHTHSRYLKSLKQLVETSPLSFKSVKLAESVFTSQADILTRQVVTKAGLSSTSNYSEADFQDMGRNVDLYIFN